MCIQRQRYHGRSSSNSFIKNGHLLLKDEGKKTALQLVMMKKFSCTKSYVVLFLMTSIYGDTQCSLNYFPSCFDSEVWRAPFCIKLVEVIPAFPHTEASCSEETTHKYYELLSVLHVVFISEILLD